MAARDEIREAYRSKSKKHHPDLGGDEWAFRMVARAYEVLMTTAPTPDTNGDSSSERLDFTSFTECPARAAWNGA